LLLGPGSVEQYIVGIVTCLENILLQQAACQRQDEDGDLDDDDQDLTLFNQATETLVAIAKVAGTNPNLGN